MSGWCTKTNNGKASQCKCFVACLYSPPVRVFNEPQLTSSTVIGSELMAGLAWRRSLCSRCSLVRLYMWQFSIKRISTNYNVLWDYPLRKMGWWAAMLHLGGKSNFQARKNVIEKISHIHCSQFQWYLWIAMILTGLEKLQNSGLKLELRNWVW